MGTYELAWIVVGMLVYSVCELWVKTRPEKGRCTKCGKVDYLHEWHDEEKLCDVCDEKRMESTR